MSQDSVWPRLGGLVVCDVLLELQDAKGTAVARLLNQYSLLLVVFARHFHFGVENKLTI